MSVIKMESKSLLAKLLATENISVQYTPGIKTAAFDLKSRVLMLPLWDNISNDLNDLLLGHETGHALDTPVQEYKDAYEKIAKNVFGKTVNEQLTRTVSGFLNVIEDVRIDKRQKRRYPGLRKNYLNGYKELFDRNFFGTAGRDVNSMSFIDRLNLYFKGGNIHLDIEFSPEEKAFLKRLENIETFPETVALTEEIYRYCKQKLEEQGLESSDLSFGEESDEDGEGDGSDDSDGNSGSDGDGEDGEGDGEKDGSSKGEGKESEKPGKGKARVKIKRGKPDQSAESGPGRGWGAADKHSVPAAPVSETYEEYDRNIQGLVKNENSNYVYVNLPNIDWKKAINGYKKVMKDWHDNINGTSANDPYCLGANKLEEMRREFTVWRMKEKDSISFMVKEFEQRKAAEAYTRTRTARTGVIDMNKIHSYKFNEDLFRRVSVVPTGKNHGFVMILDWSGSMHGNLHSTIKQLLTLCLFCRQIQVPFEVYAFRDSGAECPFRTIGIPNCIQPGRVVMRNFLSSKMKTDEFNFAASVLWSIGKGHNLRTVDGLGGTPLNEAILIAPKIINDFRKEHKLEIVNTVFLTDGDGNGWSSNLANSTEPRNTRNNKYFFSDKETGKIHEISFDYYGGSMTPTFLNIMKDRAPCNLLGFFLFDGGFARMSRRFDVSTANDKASKFWKDNKFYPVKTAGYDEYYIIDVDSMSDDKNELEIGKSTTNSKMMAKAFTQYAAKKTVNRVLLRQFIEKVSGHGKKSA